MIYVTLRYCHWHLFVGEWQRYMLLAVSSSAILGDGHCLPRSTSNRTSSTKWHIVKVGEVPAIMHIRWLPAALEIHKGLGDNGAT